MGRHLALFMDVAHDYVARSRTTTKIRFQAGFD